MSTPDTPDAVVVRLAAGAGNGFASIVQQYLEQQLADRHRRRQRALRLRGRLALVASDYGAAVTIEFSGAEIAIFEGERKPVDASISGPLEALTGLVQGRTNPLIEHLHGRLRVRAKLSRLLLPLQVHRMLKLV